MDTWEYAVMTKTAKAYGGPKSWESALVLSGKMKMVPWLGVAVLGGALLTIATQKIISIAKEEKMKEKNKTKVKNKHVA